MTDIALDEKLAPCPFCDGTVKLGNENIFVCTGCGANISLYSEDIVSEWNRRASPSQVAPQPQGGEAVAYAYVVDGSAEDMGWGAPTLPDDPSLVLLYASPQPANPAQVTDATDEAVRLAGDILMSHGLNAPEQVIYRAAREILETAAIGTGGQAVGTDEIFDWLDTELSAIDCWYRGDPVHEHDAFWFKDKARDLVKDARKAFPSALSQPHPADERVVEALRKIEYCLTKDSLCEAEKIDDALKAVRRLIAAKEVR